MPVCNCSIKEHNPDCPYHGSLAKSESSISSTVLLDAGDFLAQMAHEFKKAAKARHDCPNIAHCRGYVESEGDLVIAIARWIEASNAKHEAQT